MRNQRSLTIIGLTVGTALALTACGAGGPGDQSNVESMDEMDPVELTVAEYNPEGSVWLDGLTEFIDYVEQESNEQITFELYTAASLMEAEDMLDGVGGGSADLGRLTTSYWPQEMPAANWYLDMGATHDTSYPHGMLQMSARAHEIHMSGPIRDEFEAHNVTPLTTMTQSQMYDLMCTQPVDSLSDAEGLRVRTLGETWVEEAEALGMTAVPLPINEVYEALQRGVVDCAISQVPSNIDYGLWEVAPHYVPVNMSNLDGLPFVINTDVWEGLPDDAQDLLHEGSHLAWTTMMDSVLDSYDEFATTGVEQHDIQFHDSRELDEALATFQEERVETMTDDVPDSVNDPDAFISDVNSLNTKWSEIIDDSLPLERQDRDPDAIQESFQLGGEVDTAEFWDRLWEEGFANHTNE